MGTLFTLVAYGRDEAFLSEVANEVFEEIDRLDSQMSNYQPQSELSTINRDAAEQAVLVEPRLFALLQYAMKGSEDSGGDFDVTVGPLMKLWGFFRGQGHLPSQSEISDVLKRIGYQHVHLDNEHRTVRFDVSGMEIDLGGIAKGYAVDKAAEILRENGVPAALISSGTSSIYALGSPPGERGWKVTVRDPFEEGKPADVLYLKNFALSTSGSYEKFFTIGGKTYCHIMNPHTGWPVENMLSTVAAVPTGTESEVLTKVFFVGGVEKYLEHPKYDLGKTVLVIGGGDIGFIAAPRAMRGDGGNVDAVGNGVAALHGAPSITLRGAVLGLFIRMPADGGGIK
jgi:thiamine biosynthesis lipoprotein